MKYKLETIPVWDALKEDTECPFCVLMEKAESRYVQYYLGNSAMNPETRVEVNASGFCPEHFSKLLLARNPQHLGLIAHTHLQDWMTDLSRRSPVGSGRSLARMVKKGGGPMSEYARHIEERRETCLICDRIERTLKRYTFTTAWLWKKEEEGFRQALTESKGFCIPHAKSLLQMGDEILSPAEMAEFLSFVEDLQSRNLERLEKEIHWFTQKFKSENHSKPWGTSEDAHYRVIQKLTGRRTPH